VKLFQWLPRLVRPPPKSLGNNPIRVGSAEVRSLAWNSASSESAAEIRWFFAHASVGSNMVDGLAELRVENRDAFPITTVFSDVTPPADTKLGVVYERSRGNPGWKAKIDGFETLVRSGWHSPRVDVVLNKLCYIDYRASFRYYAQSMATLEAEFPETTFVYMTMPLTTTADIRNLLRNRFNTALRRWTAETHRPLFDVADIEARDAEGRECAFEIAGRSFQRLFRGYTDDGGHLNAEGRRMAALGFYAFAARLMRKPGDRGGGLRAQKSSDRKTPARLFNER
jgi:hypothetical protein